MPDTIRLTVVVDGVTVQLPCEGVTLSKLYVEFKRELVIKDAAGKLIATACREDKRAG